MAIHKEIERGREIDMRTKFLRNEPQPQHTQLLNGANVVTLQKEGCKACIAIFADIGSRYELEFENGIAHMFEHMVFKSTKVMSRMELSNNVNALGMKLHAFTTRELVGYYIYCLSDNVYQAITILSQCVLNNALSVEELSCEKRTVYEEIIKQDKNPKSLVFDYLHATAFQGTGLANTILGTTKNLSSVDSVVIARYMQRMLHPCRLCLCAVGAVCHDPIVELANKYLSWNVPSPCKETLYRYTGSDVRYRNDTLPRAHVAYALEGPPFSHVDTVYMELAANLIGGWDKTQVGDVNHGVAVARKAALGDVCDSYKSFNIKYKDTSLWGVQFLSSSLDLEDMMFNIQDTLLGMCTMATEGEMERAKEQMKSKMLQDWATCYGAAKDMAKYTLYNCCYWPPLSDRLEFIDNIKLEDFTSTMYRYLYNKCPAIAAVGPTEGLPDYNRIRASQYWLRL
ncbi:mitochondrial-processing peptidase subunit beta-like [Leguminivora glycinivorella]|uniref:mitochondrial-processing peptidase subunit beta-like n=1 Tax=Leguminivora glycinivorella TaxID=1035111 RepID=UPI00200D3C5E|nr:mitochondrial-processing peptidase subunit beta-like [Leguminivora glycinivorella]